VATTDRLLLTSELAMVFFQEDHCHLPDSFRNFALREALMMRKKSGNASYIETQSTHAGKSCKLSSFYDRFIASIYCTITARHPVIFRLQTTFTSALNSRYTMIKGILQ
jgi:hypothetical protein